MAEQYDIRISHTKPAASLLTFNVGGSPVNLTNYTATVRVRSLDDTDATITDLTTANGGVTLGGVAGTITINWPSVINSLPEVGHYRVDVTNASGVHTNVTTGTLLVEDKP